MAEPRWTLVTGASSGIGAALARAFAVDGDALVLVARRRDRLEALAGSLRGRPVEVIEADLADPAAPERLLAEVERRGITLHTLVNNAGFGLRGPFADGPYERLIGMVEVNVVSLTRLCRLVLPRLVAARRGGVLNVASTAAFQAGPNMAVYYATKAFVLSLSEALHEEVRDRGVVVSALCPGPTTTEFQAVADMEGIPLMKFGAMTAEDVARTGLAGYRAGQAIIIPGALNKAGAFGVRFSPRVLARRIAGALQA